MGLDMYLKKHLYIGNHYRKERGEEMLQTIVPASLKTSINDEKISEIVEDAGYWRKANAIHAWFIDNCAEGEDNGQDIYVGRDQLEELLKTCKTVLKASKLVKGKVKNGERSTANGWEPIMEDGMTIEDKSVAEELLPTQSGFFFGSTDYDEYYIDDVKLTIDILEKALASDDGDFYYRASW